MLIVETPGLNFKHICQVVSHITVQLNLRQSFFHKNKCHTQPCKSAKLFDTGYPLLYFSIMATTIIMARSEHPLDLGALQKSAQTSAPECLLMDHGDLETMEDQIHAEGRASPSGPSIGLVLDAGQPATQARTARAYKKGLKLILWKTVPAAQPDSLKKALWNASRAGIWNHLVFPANKGDVDTGLLGFALNNPNIANSYSFTGDRFLTSPGDTETPVSSIRGYSRVKPLPGKPLWAAIGAPEQLLLFLHTYGIKQVQKWRVMEDGRQVNQLGRSIDYYFAEPDALPPGFLDEICRMVEAGGSVDMIKVRYNLERAFLIGYAMEFGLVAGNSSLKHPRPEYIQSLHENTGLDFNGYLERGYTSVRPEYRGTGIGTRLLEGLTERTQGKKLYSIITEDNLATQKIAIRNKTRKLTTFFSRKAGKEVGVWVSK